MGMNFTRNSLMNLLPAGLVAVAGLTGFFELAHAQSAAGVPASPQITFTKDIAPILEKSCQNCHRPESMAPMPLLTYKDVRPWARSIKSKVLQREMPPWFIDKTVGIGQFKDDPSLSDQEIATIAAWVDAGAPEGNPADMPAPRKFRDDDQWHIGKPDLIIQMPVSFSVKAHGPDWWGNFDTASGLGEDRYI